MRGEDFFKWVWVGGEEVMGFSSAEEEGMGWASVMDAWDGEHLRSGSLA